ncbi:P-loop containing nucleoside triphosphate hydrolase protein [Hypoxylon sp. FL1284]|nr:P-loop containing nucleoside triphosphate hydrolase protein [Hypoxylon sp. FL1284]
MAPRTRRSLASAGQNSPANSPPTGIANTPNTQPTPSKRRGRPPKSVPKSVPKSAPEPAPEPAPKATVGSRSASDADAPTPATTISDSEYSTPATSNAVTPVPSVSTKKPAAKSAATASGSRSILTIELPDAPQGSLPKPTGFKGTRRRPAPISYKEDEEVEDEDEDEEYYPGDKSRSAALARKLQREEAQKPIPSPIPSTRKKPMPSRAKRPLQIDSSDEDEDKDDAAPRHKPGRRAFKKQKNVEPESEDQEDVDSDAVMASSGDDDLVFRSDSSDSDILESDSEPDSESDSDLPLRPARATTATSRASKRRSKKKKLEDHHPELLIMWTDLKNMPALDAGQAEQPDTISRELKPFQLQGLAWMKGMEQTQWKGGLLGDEMGLGKTIQAVSLIMSDHPAKAPSLVLVPPVALMQWTTEIESYTNGKLKTFIYHGTNTKAKSMTAKDLKKFDVIMMSYNTLESMYRKQEKGFKRKKGTYKEKSPIHQIKFHRVILDEAHCIKSRTTMTAKACFALNVEYRWCLTGTPLANRIGEFFSLLRFLRITPFASYCCKQCSCSHLEWSPDNNGYCQHCHHFMMRHVSVFNVEILNPLTKYGNRGEGKEGFQKLRLLTDRIMLRRLKKDHMNAMELPVKEVVVTRQFFGEEENDLAQSVMTNSKRNFDTYVAEGVLLNNYANIFGLLMQMRQIADHPDLILKKTTDPNSNQNVLVCCICDEPAEEAIRSRCKHDFCRACAKSYVNSQEEPDCPCCHIPLSIDLEQPEMEQDEVLVKKSSIINRIKMENWTSSSKIELLVRELHALRKNNFSSKSIIFSQFTTMLQLIEWRLRRAGITTVMLDGSMTPAQRQASINHFMKNVDVECFLVSLKAGGVALNLTEASRVFIVDPWWNPAAEWQSADRCHRIGQTRPCIITRLCIEDSVESRMVLLQEKKTNMINSTINADDASMEALTTEDLQFLFRGT